ncbi:MAG: hypothetical protein Q7W02_28135 [Candidatus Rokubacteria bacterium]|nr:hypothetical protein [Candidatus Rokubacteria bacterium]
MTRRIVIVLLLSAALAGGISTPAAAEEVRQGLNAPMILQMLSRPVEKPESVMREMLRPDAVQAKPVRFDQPQVMPDGSVRYGTDAASVTMTIRNPCPPGDVEHEMMALRSLPGRGRK